MKQIDYLWFLKLRYAAAEIWHGSAATTPWCRSTQCTSIFHFRFQLSCLLLGFSWKMNFYDEPFLPMVSSKKIIDLNLSHSLHLVQNYLLAHFKLLQMVQNINETFAWVYLCGRLFLMDQIWLGWEMRSVNMFAWFLFHCKVAKAFIYQMGFWQNKNFYF